MGLGATIVVGGGLSGLVRAHVLARRSEEVYVLEASGRAGGVVRTEKADGYLLELGPNTVRPTPEIWGLVEELGLAGSALLADPRLPRFVELEGKLHRLAPGPQTLLLTRLLSPLGKLRLLAEPFVRSGTEPRESVRAFFARRLGWQVADRLVAPFVSGIWAGDADRLSAASVFPVLKRWEIEHGSLLRGALSRRPRHEGSSRPVPRGLLSFSEGLETLPRALADRLGPRLRTESPVRTLKPDGKGWR
ncbi:MAG TPA: protoporphyrinogen oxidase, partial [Thermoanaerobaculia bacterium]|nr:protoporphyrinogen oxidase [Thermoanaerobaculia bacterium]